jgi:hypothetical protein
MALISEALDFRFDQAAHPVALQVIDLSTIPREGDAIHRNRPRLL